MSYWRHEKVASVKEFIEKLTAYEKKHGRTAITSIGTVCSGTRQTEYYVEVQDANAENKETLSISSVTMGELNENEAYASAPHDTGWHDLILNPKDMPDMNMRVLLECENIIGEYRQIWHAVGHRIDNKSFVADGCQYIPKVLAWQAITPRNR